MNGNQLSATSSGGQQNATQSPQTASGGSFAPGQKGSAVQSGTPTAALEGGATGISLSGSSPTVVNVPAATATTTSAPKKEVTKPHFDTPLGLISTVIFIAAVALMIWSSIGAAKNTTD